ncbi:MAG: response regulator [Deltaproteobacteria bacterium]|nr:response regulator [Deltaproteobacteria bacterium]
MILKFPQTLVVIDDDPLILALAEKAFEHDYHFSVVTFTDACKALSFISEHGVRFVVTDIRMPDCDGSELIERLRKLPFGVCAAVMSGNMDLTIARRCYDMGAALYLKPVGLEQYHAIAQSFKKKILLWNHYLETVAWDKNQHQPSGRESRKRILLVEDEASLAEVVREFLASDYTVEWLNNGRAIGDKIKWADLMVLDINLLDVSGLDILSSLSLEIGSEIPVIVTSGFVSGENLEQSPNVKAVLEKPYRIEELAACIRTALS